MEFWSKVIRSTCPHMLLGVLCFAFSAPTNASGMSASSVAYDGLTQPKVAYDEGLLLAFNYDFAPFLSDQDEDGNMGPFANFVGFLAAERGFVLGEGSVLRKINLRPDTPNWGINSYHVEKHLFGDGKFSLKTIDPAGTPDKWMHHLTELFNSPATGKTSNGMLDIIKQFPKPDGSGTFNMGIRLSPRAEGTFDLITILTKQ